MMPNEGLNGYEIPKTARTAWNQGMRTCSDILAITVINQGSCGKPSAIRL